MDSVAISDFIVGVLAWLSLAFLILFAIFGIKSWLDYSYMKGYKDRDDEDKSDEEKIRYPW